MAKSARSSDRKRNNAKLRSEIFGPAHDARTARLSAKLQELAAQPKPEQDKAMEIDADKDSLKDTAVVQEKDADVAMGGLPSSRAKVQKKKTSNRIEKTSRQKPRNKMVFPTNLAKSKRLAKSKKRST